MPPIIPAEVPLTSNFAARIADAAARFPDRTAIEVLRADLQVETTTYAALLSQAGRFAGWLAANGMGPGDRAAILSDNSAAWIAAYLGILRIGGVAVPLDTAYKAAQVRTVIDNSGARVLFVSLRYLDTARAASDAAGPAAPRLVLLSGTAPGIPGEADVAAAAVAPPLQDVEHDTAAVILYTSGTTADPKGVVLTHANLEGERRAALALVPVSEDDAVLGVLPLFHSLAQMANLLLPLASGARVVFLETVSSSALLSALATRGITILACVPQFFYLIHQRVTTEVARGGALRKGLFRLLVAGNVWLRNRLGWNPGRRVFARVHRVLGHRIRVLVTGGSRFDETIARDLYGMGFTVLNAYGLTETSGGATMMRTGDRFTTSVGRPFPGVDVRIDAPSSGEDGHLDGEILIRGPIVMREYYRRPDATAEAIRGGWLYTGDLGRLDADGRLYITGRRKEMIVLSSGKNLYPEEIETHYRQASIVKELCVLGLARPGQPSAERLHAVIVPDEDAMRLRGVVNVGELVRFELESLAVQLPAHKRVLSYDIWTEPLPRTTTGKIRRHEVQRRVLEQAARDAAPTEARALSAEETAWLGDAVRASLLEDAGARLGRATIAPDANLELDLGLDSMERVELLTHLEQRRGTRIAPDVRQTIFTARQLIDAVVAAPSAAGPPADGLEAANGASGLEWDALLAEPPEAELFAPLSRFQTARAIVIFGVLRIIGFFARLALGFQITGREHLPRSGPFLLSPNHLSYLDGFFLASALPFSALRQLFFVGAAEYFQTPFTAWLARMLNIVPVDPDANLVNAMRAGAAGLRQGQVLALFPEGERSIDGELKKFKKGAAILSAHVQAPIVPVALDGLYDLWPRGRPFQWRRLLGGRAQPVRLQFGAPIRVPRDGYDAGTAELRSAVERMLGRPPAGR